MKKNLNLYRLKYRVDQDVSRRSKRQNHPWQGRDQNEPYGARDGWVRHPWGRRRTWNFFQREKNCTNDESRFWETFQIKLALCRRKRLWRLGYPRNGPLPLLLHWTKGFPDLGHTIMNAFDITYNCWLMCGRSFARQWREKAKECPLFCCCFEEIFCHTLQAIPSISGFNFQYKRSKLFSLLSISFTSYFIW